MKGRYRFESVLGCGGLGAVYKATDLQTGQFVAVRENCQYRTFARFAQEAGLLMLLNHKNLLKVYQSFLDTVTRRAYLVMDYAAGETLKKIMSIGRVDFLGKKPNRYLSPSLMPSLTGMSTELFIGT